MTARALAAELGCSVKPIFGLFKNMEEVGQEVFIASDLLYQNYLREDMAKGKYPPIRQAAWHISALPKKKGSFSSCFLCVTEAVKNRRKQRRNQTPYAVNTAKFRD